MKKTLLTTAAVILFSAQAAAQYDPDTVYYGDPLYLFNPQTQLFNIAGDYFAHQFNPERMALAYKSPEPTWIHGVSLTIGSYRQQSVTNLWYGVSAPYIKPTCFAALLLQKDPNTGQMTLIDSAQWHYPHVPGYCASIQSTFVGMVRICMIWHIHLAIP